MNAQTSIQANTRNIRAVLKRMRAAQNSTDILDKSRRAMFEADLKIASVLTHSPLTDGEADELWIAAHEGEEEATHGSTLDTI